MRSAIAGVTAGLLLLSSAASADGWGRFFDFHSGHGQSFNRIATFANYRNLDAQTQTVSEIVAASADGMTLVYTDAATGSIGIVDISDPRNPRPAGTVSFRDDPEDGPDDEDEPTSVDVLGNRYALVAVNTSEDFIDTSGELVVVDIVTRDKIDTIPLSGQPDSLKISPDERFAAIVIENERDEEICVGGSADAAPVPEDDDAAEDACIGGGGQVGVIPQNGPDTAIGNPPGVLEIVDTLSWTPGIVDLTGFSEDQCFAPSDPEPEFVDVNEDNLAVVSLQENNCLAVVDLETGLVENVFGAGTVDLDAIDNDEDDIIVLDDSLANVAREPDAVTWVESKYGEAKIATANEGDLFGGSRGFTIFDRAGNVVFDIGNAFEHEAVRAGHYPESRSENKGAEPEAVEFGRFGFDDYLFVGSERGSFVAVYEIGWSGEARFRQILPAPLGPEGVLAIPGRDLLIVSGEEDDEPNGVRSTMMIYQLERGRADYPEILSDLDEDGQPIPWSALSGMTAAPPGRGNDLLAVQDSYYAESRIFTIDASARPARITQAVTITGADYALDPEGIAVAPDRRSYWIASEGNDEDTTDPDWRPNLLVQTDTHGNVLQQVQLPDEILACRDASTATGTLGSGFEGVAAVGNRRHYVLLVAQQRGWDYTTEACEDLDDDAGGLDDNGQPRQTRIWIYDPRSDSWGHIAWELEAVPANASWVGLSEITSTGSSLIVIERDNRTGDRTGLKTLVEIRVRDVLDWHVSAAEKSVFDLLPAMNASNGWISDKPEGVAVDRRGRLYLVTDNDGVDDWSGETSFLRLGRYSKLFR